MHVVPVAGGHRDAPPLADLNPPVRAERTGCRGLSHPERAHPATWSGRDGRVRVTARPADTDLTWIAQVHARYGTRTLDWEQTLGTSQPSGETLDLAVALDEPFADAASAGHPVHVRVKLIAEALDGTVRDRQDLPGLVLVGSGADRRVRGERELRNEGESTVVAMRRVGAAPWVDERAAVLARGPRPLAYDWDAEDAATEVTADEEVAP